MFTTNQGCFFYPSLTLLTSGTLYTRPNTCLCSLLVLLKTKTEETGGDCRSRHVALKQRFRMFSQKCHSMLTGLDWISDGEKVITDSHSVSVGMYKMFKWPYHKQCLWERFGQLDLRTVVLRIQRSPVASWDMPCFGTWSYLLLDEDCDVKLGEVTLGISTDVLFVLVHASTHVV